jgi:hypothetical protein
MMRRRAQPDAREASSLLVGNHVEVLCVYRSGGVCQEGGDTKVYVALPRKLSRRRRVCGTREEAKEAARAEGILGDNLGKVMHTSFNLLPFGMSTRKGDMQIKGNVAKSLHTVYYLPKICDGECIC